MIVALMFAAAVTVSRAQATTVERIQARARTVKRWGGIVLIAVGVWFVALALAANVFARIFPV